MHPCAATVLGREEARACDQEPERAPQASIDMEQPVEDLLELREERELVVPEEALAALRAVGRRNRGAAARAARGLYGQSDTTVPFDAKRATFAPPAAGREKLHGAGPFPTFWWWQTR